MKPIKIIEKFNNVDSENEIPLEYFLSKLKIFPIIIPNSIAITTGPNINFDEIEIATILIKATIISPGIIFLILSKS